MPFVAILGAGSLGGALASALASHGRFDQLRLIDPQGSLAAGKALDILQSGPIEGVTTRVTGSSSLEAAEGAWVTVLADPSPSAPADLAGTLDMARDLHRRSPGAVLVCADVPHRLLVARAVATGAVPPDRIVASAPGACASAARALVALEADTSPALVLVQLIAGSAPAANTSCTVDWERTSIAGEPASERLSREARVRLDARLAATWPPGPLTLAAAAARVAEAAWFGARSPYACWWSDDGGASQPKVHLLRFAPGGRVAAWRAAAAAGR